MLKHCIFPARLVSASLLLGALAACVSPSQQLIRQGQPPEYAVGYEQGCASGRVAGGSWGYRFVKDAARFQSDQLYADGWTDGFNVCKGKEEEVSRMFGPVL